MNTEAQTPENVARVNGLTERLDSLERSIAALSQSVEAHFEYFENVTGRMMETTERVRSHARDDLERLRSDLDCSIDSVRRDVEGLERQSRYRY